MMEEFKGTKGEWETRSSDPTVITQGLVDIAEVFCQDMHNKDLEQSANAKIIAAAPDLLESLQGMVRMYESVEPTGGWQGQYEAALYAIEKALK